MIILVLSLVVTLVIIFFAFRFARNMLGGGKEAQRILATGIPAQARILQVTETGMRVNNRAITNMVLEIHIPGQQPYQTQTRRAIAMIEVPRFQPGSVIPVKVDPANLMNVVIAI